MGASSNAFSDLINVTKSQLEIKLMENVGGEGVLVKHEAKLVEKGGGRGSRAIFSDRKNKNLRY